MTRTIIKSQIGTDGVLHLDIPMGVSEAGRQVQITIEPDANVLKAQQDHRDSGQADVGVPDVAIVYREGFRGQRSEVGVQRSEVR